MPATITCFAGHEGDADQLLADAGAYVQAHGFEHATMFRNEKPNPNIIHAMDECGADLLVLGAAKRTKIGRKLLGDTARFALENSTRPIFLHH